MRSNNTAVKWFTNGMGKMGKNRGKKSLLPMMGKKGNIYLYILPFSPMGIAASSAQIVSAFITHSGVAP